MHRHSVVITTHKRPVLLGRAIRSVKDQTIEDNIQIIVVSDVDCPQTYAAAVPLLGAGDAFVQRAGAPGPAASRNIGLKLVDAAFTAFLDDDDAFTSDFFEKIDAYLSHDDVLYTDYHVVFETSVETGCKPLRAEKRSLGERGIGDLHVKNFIPLHCAVYPTRVIRDLSFDTALKLNEDWAFLLDVAKKAAFRHLPVEGPIIYTRERADNRGRSNDDLLIETYQTIYKTWPAPTTALKQARQAFLQANGVAAEISDL